MSKNQKIAPSFQVDEKFKQQTPAGEMLKELPQDSTIRSSGAMIRGPQEADGMSRLPTKARSSATRSRPTISARICPTTSSHRPGPRSACSFP